MEGDHKNNFDPMGIYTWSCDRLPEAEVGQKMNYALFFYKHTSVANLLTFHVITSSSLQYII